MTKEKDSKIRGIIGTILFHAGLLLLLFFLGLSTPLPLPGEEGVEVNLGYSDQGMGFDQQPEPAPAEEESPPPQTDEDTEEQIITQETEEAPVIEEPKKKDPQPEKKTIEVKKTEEPVEKPVEQPKVNPKALYKGKSTTTSEGGQEGQTGQPGDQGNPNGDPNAGNYEGEGGKGDGPGFDLGGRGARSLPLPSYNSNDQGDVVVEIFVDRDGNVVSARAGVKGTTINDSRLWEVARDAAMRSKFVTDPNAPEKQRGTITYKFRRKGG